MSGKRGAAVTVPSLRQTSVRRGTRGPGGEGIEAVVFDAYGTLLDFTEPDFIATMAEICGQQALDCDAADLWKRFLRAAYLLRSETHHDPVYKRYDQAWADQFQHVFRRLRLNADPYAAANHLKARLADAPAFEEAAPVVEALRRHYRVALMSNADDDFLETCLEKNGLRFETVVTSERAGAIKPNPAIFGFLAGVLDIAPQRILYAGDNPIPDVLGPLQSGMQAAWINRTGMRRPRRVPRPHYRLRSLSELLPLLLPDRD
jgi:2-haloalkanoic acid dehalogenase type II